MAKRRIGVLEIHEFVDSAEPQTFCGRGIADHLLANGDARSIGKRLIKMVRGRAEDAIKQAKAARDAMLRAIEKQLDLEVRSFWEGPLGRGNLIPFARMKNQGDKLHYETPMAGDKTAFARSRRREISVSTRGLFSQPGIQWQNYAQLA